MGLGGLGAGAARDQDRVGQRAREQEDRHLPPGGAPVPGLGQDPDHRQPPQEGRLQRGRQSGHEEVNKAREIPE